MTLREMRFTLNEEEWAEVYPITQGQMTTRGNLREWVTAKLTTDVLADLVNIESAGLSLDLLGQQIVVRFR